MAVLAQGSLWRLTFCLLCVVALLRYRSAVPLLFSLLAVNYFAGEILLHYIPLVRIGTPPGPLVNLILFSLMLVGLALSVSRRTRQAAQQ